MTTVVTRAAKGAELTWAEVDANFDNLNNNKVETSAVSNVDNTSDVNKPISNAIANALSLKQNVLVSGENLKTVGGLSLLGIGNISLNAPFEPITASVTPAIAGGNYSFQNATAQVAATNMLPNSGRIIDAPWTIENGATGFYNVQGPDDSIPAIAWPGVGDCYQYVSVATLKYSTVVRVKAFGTLPEKYHFQSSNGTVSFYSSNLNLAAKPNSCEKAFAVYLGDGWVEIQAVFNNGPVNLVFYAMNQGGVAQAYGGCQLAESSDYQNYIATKAIPVTRPAGVIAPQRIVLPASPAANDAVSVKVANGITNNIVDPNGLTIEDTAGPMTLDSTSASVTFQNINNSWRLV